MKKHYTPIEEASFYVWNIVKRYKQPFDNLSIILDIQNINKIPSSLINFSTINKVLEILISKNKIIKISCGEYEIISKSKIQF